MAEPQTAPAQGQAAKKRPSRSHRKSSTAPNAKTRQGGNAIVNANRNAEGARARWRVFAPGFEGMISLYLAANPEETITTMRVPAVFAFIETLRATADRPAAARPTRPHRATSQQKKAQPAKAQAETPAETTPPPAKGKTHAAGR